MWVLRGKDSLPRDQGTLLLLLEKLGNPGKRWPIPQKGTSQVSWLGQVLFFKKDSLNTL